ncbi:hypothetical protein ABID22_001610 [Pontibacter aydingkolensis]
MSLYFALKAGLLQAFFKQIIFRFNISFMLTLAIKYTILF